MLLKKIAASMHLEAKETGQSIQVLQRGLQLKMLYRQEDIVLVMSRPDVPPSEEEVKICHEAVLFGMPLSNKAVAGNSIFIAITCADLFGVRIERIQQAISKEVPAEAIQHAVTLFKSEDPLHWSAAEATLRQWESPYGTRKKIEPGGQMFIPEITSGKKKQK